VLIPRQVQDFVAPTDLSQELDRKVSDSATPEQARINMLPMMTEPDSCPFQQAQLLTEEKDFNLLADDLLPDEQMIGSPIMNNKKTFNILDSNSSEG
jgi:hypothetical protein